VTPWLLAATLVGYVLGRTRPIERFVTWNWERAIWGFGHGQHLRWVTTMDGALFAVLHPVKFWRALHAKPVTRPVPKVGLAWLLANRDTASDVPDDTTNPRED
jgi:hypothetical protein